MIQDHDAKSSFLVVLVLAFVVVICLGQHFGYASLLGSHGCDLYQLLADGFRQGQLSLPVSGAKVAVYDSAQRGDSIYLNQGPFPAALYAVIDWITDLLAGWRIPKMPLFVLAAIIHLFALYNLLLRLVPRGVAVSLLLTLSYAVSSPFLDLVAGTDDLSASEIGILFSSTLVLLALWSWLWYEERPSASRAALPALLMGFAWLARPTCLAYAVGMAGVVLMRRGLRREAVCFGGIVLGAIGVYLLYNVARFGDPTDFGNQYSHAGVWEEVVFNHGILPTDLNRDLSRWIDALRGWFGWGVSPGADAWNLYDIEGGSSLLERANLLLIGLPAGALVWLGAHRKPGIEIVLAAGIVGIIAFYVLFWQSVSPRYALDVWPELLLLSVAGLHYGFNAMQAKWNGRWLSHGFISIILVALAICHLGGPGDLLRSLFEQGNPREFPSISSHPLSARDLLDQSRDTCPESTLFSGTPWVEHGRPPATLSCTTLDRLGDLSEDFGPWKGQQSVRRLGIYRRSDGRCFMLFFSGATLWRASSRPCRVEIRLDRGGIEDCSSVELHLDGVPRGPMSQVRSNDPDELVCSRSLPGSDPGAVRTYFLFEDGIKDVQSKVQRDGLNQGRRELRTAARHFGFREVGIICDTEP